MQALKLANEEYFELLPGKVLDIQINHPVPYRNKMLLIGYEVGKYIILKYPKVVRSNDLNDVLVEGNGVIVRYLLEGQSGKCYAFRASIKYIVQYPEKLIYLTYPDILENRELRKQRRQVTHIPASISLLNANSASDDVKIKGVISDINAKGCGFSFKTENDKLMVNKRNVFVNIHSPNNGMEQIAASVCNCRNEGGLVNVGIQFINAEQQVTDLLADLQIESS
ncbi:MAG: flagellar brake domain-containing protein [Thalassotalea sp.]